jgi:hypothetical protein
MGLLVFKSIFFNAWLLLNYIAESTTDLVTFIRFEYLDCDLMFIYDLFDCIVAVYLVDMLRFYIFC